MTATPEVLHKPIQAQRRFAGLIERVLTSVAAERGLLEIPVPPSGSIYLNAMLRGRTTFEFPGAEAEEAPRLYFGGQLVKSMPIARIETPLTLVGLQFSATGFSRLFHADASRLTDRTLPLTTIAPALAERLEASLQASMTVAQVAQILQDTLWESLPEARPAGLADRAIARIDQRKGRIEMSDLADTCGVSPRHLRRVFARDVGLSPKSYAKTVQLKEIVSVLQSAEDSAMHDLALDHGYYDQSHFVRDFKRAVGSNPTAFLSSRDLFLEMFLGRKK